MDVNNAKQFGKIYYARHFVPGIARYEDGEMLMVDDHAIAEMAPTFAGKPIYVHHQQVDMDQLHNSAGYVVDCFKHADGWYWSKVLITSDDGHDAVGKGWSVSNSYYKLDEDTTGGTHLNVAYNSKLTKGSFTHLALTPTPRYEQARLFTPEQYRAYTADYNKRHAELFNSKPEGTKMFNLFKTVKQPVTEIDADTMIEIDGRAPVKFSEMLNAVEAASAPAQTIDAKTLIKVGDKEMSIGDLQKKYLEIENATETKNAGSEPTNDDADGDEKPAAPAEVPLTPAPPAAPSEPVAPDNGDAAPDAPKPDHFKELSNAHNAPQAAMLIEGNSTMLKRGQELFSIKK